MRRLLPLAALLVLAGCAATPDAGARRFIVFFQEWSARLDPAATGAIGEAAAEANAHPSAKVMVIGFADPTGSAQANIDISRTRAQIVMDTLVGDGVAAGRIQRSARGATSFELSSQESRRVEIVVGP